MRCEFSSRPTQQPYSAVLSCVHPRGTARGETWAAAPPNWPGKLKGGPEPPTKEQPCLQEGAGLSSSADCSLPSPRTPPISAAAERESGRRGGRRQDGGGASQEAGGTGSTTIRRLRLEEPH